MFTNWSLLTLCINFLKISYQNYLIITSQHSTKFMIKQLKNQVDLTTFYLESLNLLDRTKSNLEVLNYGKKLVKIKKLNPSIILKSSLNKIYSEITDHTVRHCMYCTRSLLNMRELCYKQHCLYYLLYFIISFQLCVITYGEKLKTNKEYLD